MAAKDTSTSKSAGKKSSKAATQKTLAAAPKKTPLKKTPLKKAAIKKAVLKKSAPKKTAAEKIRVDKNVTRKSAVKKNAGPKNLTQKAVAQKPAAKKSAAKKSAAKKSAAKKSAVKDSVKKPAAKQANLKKVIVKKAAVKKAAAQTPVKTKAKIAPPLPISHSPAQKKARPDLGGAAKPRTGENKLRTGENKPLRRENEIKPASPVANNAQAAEGTPRAKREKSVETRTVAVPRVSARQAPLARKPARSAARRASPGAASAPAIQDSKARQEKKPVKAVKPISEQKLRADIRTAVLYLEAWLRNESVEKAAILSKLASPAESARAQVWRWLEQGVEFEDGQKITPSLLEEILAKEMNLLAAEIEPEAFQNGRFVSAAQLFLDLSLAPDFGDFPGAQSQDLLKN